LSQSGAYARVGVDITAGTRATELMANAVKATYGPEVLSGIGAFGGMYDASALKTMASPVLVASTDGVGTKTRVAARLGRWDTLGYDLVNHCINDILVQGARPLFFLDYVAASRVHPEQVAEIVGGVAAACRDAGCALLGGETAEMPGVYEPGELDLAGTIVGLVERRQILDGSRSCPGDVILAMPSTGLHTNGYSLARRVLDGLNWHEPHAELGCSVGEALLAVHRSYLQPVGHLTAAGVDIKGLAHITGGGIVDNLPRILPAGSAAVIWCGSWTVPPVFNLIQKRGEIDDAEMFHVFNMGLGMLMIVSPSQVERIQSVLPDDVYLVGEIIAGEEQHVTIEGDL
jgi:phosphoribosylformylglycinamidine cyclo-ligase